MQIKKSTLAHKQPIHWRQAISQSKYNKFGWKNFYIYPLTKYTFSYRNYQSFLTDSLILGSNPIITHLLLCDLHKKNLDNFVNTGERLNVTILVDNDLDYWSYHTFKQTEYLQYLSDKVGIIFNSVDDIFNYAEDVYGANSSLEINIVQSHDMSVHYFFRKEKFVDGYIFHLKSKQINQNDYENSMPNVIKLENDIKQDYWYLLKKKMNQHCFGVDFGEKVINKDNEVKTNIILTKNVYITSFVNGWLASKKQQKQVEIENVNFFVTEFSNQFHESYGSAKMMGDDFVNFKMLSLDQVIELFHQLKGQI